MSRVAIAVLVSGGGTNLQALIDSQRSGALHSGEITLVISSSPSAYALKRAEDAGIATCVCEKRGRSQEEFEADILKALKENGIELIILAGFMCILSENFVKLYPERIINVHPSLIPSFCGKGFYGLRVHEAALNYGVKVTGAPDGGKIIMQKAVYIKENDTPETLQRRVMENAEWELLPKSAEIVCESIKENR